MSDSLEKLRRDFEHFKDKLFEEQADILPQIISLEAKIFDKLSTNVRWASGVLVVVLIAIFGWVSSEKKASNENHRQTDFSIYELREQNAITALTVDNAVKTLVQSMDNTNEEIKELAKRTNAQVERTQENLIKHIEKDE